MVEALVAEGIPAVIVGRFTDSNERLILNEDEVRYTRHVGGGGGTDHAGGHGHEADEAVGECAGDLVEPYFQSSGKDASNGVMLLQISLWRTLSLAHL